MGKRIETESLHRQTELPWGEWLKRELGHPRCGGKIKRVPVPQYVHAVKPGSSIEQKILDDLRKETYCGKPAHMCHDTWLNNLRLRLSAKVTRVKSFWYIVRSRKIPTKGKKKNLERSLFSISGCNSEAWTRLPQMDLTHRLPYVRIWWSSDDETKWGERADGVPVVISYTAVQNRFER
jgi:hypothetical protein